MMLLCLSTIGKVSFIKDTFGRILNTYNLVRTRYLVQLILCLRPRYPTYLYHK